MPLKKSDNATDAIVVMKDFSLLFSVRVAASLISVTFHGGSYIGGLPYMLARRYRFVKTNTRHTVNSTVAIDRLLFLAD